MVRPNLSKWLNKRKTRISATYAISLIALNFLGVIIALAQGFPNWIWYVLGGSAANFCPEQEPTNFFGHCFPDFGTFFALPADNPWAWDFPHSHPPLAQWLQSSFISLTDLIGIEYFGALLIWTILLVTAIYFSMLVVLRASFEPSIWNYLLPLALLPNLATYFNLWTGNSTALVLPFLSLAIAGILKNTKFSWMWVGIVIALRPQLVFLVAVLFLKKRWMQVWRTCLVASSLTVATLLPYKAPPWELLLSWFSNLINYPLYASPFMYTPDSLGIGRSIVKLLEIPTNLLFGGISDNDSSSNFDWLADYLRVLSQDRAMLLVIVGSLFLILTPLLLSRVIQNRERLSTIELLTMVSLAAIVLPSTSFPYYALLTLPIVAVLLGEHLGLAQAAGTSLEMGQAAKYLLPLTFLSFPITLSILRNHLGAEANLMAEIAGLVYLGIFVSLSLKLTSLNKLPILRSGTRT